MDASNTLPSDIVNGYVHCVEHHDGAYTIWRDSAVKDRTLVHVDAHHDLYGYWTSQKKRTINIANYVYAALEDDFVREVIWVVPDETWTIPNGQRDIIKTIQRIDQGAPNKKPVMKIEADRITYTALGKPLHVCTLRTLPRLDEDVLLDIDVDYFVIPNIGYRNIYLYGSAPWRWPSELVAELKARHVHSDLVTIAYSIEGGYTPLQWKYLGDELAQRLLPGEADLAWANEMRQATEAVAYDEAASAEAHYRAACDLMPESAAPYYHLAHLCVTLDRIQEGRDYYRQALDVDPSYRTAYNSQGFWYLKNRQGQARKAFDRTLRLDPDDAYAHLGLGLLAEREKDWNHAEESLQRAVTLNQHCVDAYRGLGRLLARRHENVEAIRAYERSLKLTLSGQRPLANGAGISMEINRTLSDPEHADVHAHLARLYKMTGAYTTAITAYRMAIAVGAKSAGNWAQLALLYVKTKRWRLAASALGHAIQQIPGDLTWWTRRSWRVISQWGLELIMRVTYKKRVQEVDPSIWI